MNLQRKSLNKRSNILPARSLLSHPGHQRSQFPPLSGTGRLSLSLLPVLPQGACILGGWPFRVECTSVAAAIAPRGSLWHSTLTSKLLSLAVQVSGALLS